MNNATNKNFGAVFIIVVVLIALAGLACKLSREPTETGSSPTMDQPGKITISPHSNEAAAVAPFIAMDTLTDSPGTNLATRLVKLTAEIGGSAPMFKQWKVDKGRGFANVSASATNATLWITNAQVSDSGLYALFATNSLGVTNTTPQPLTVVEGVD